LLLSSKGCKLIALRALGPSSDRSGTGLIAEEDRYQNESGGDRVMPLDLAIAQIIPLLPLRDPATMTPQRARDELRALASARPDLPLPEVRAVESAILKGPAGSVPARVYRVAPAPSPTVLFFHGGGFVSIWTRMTGKRDGLRLRPAPSSFLSTIGARLKCPSHRRSRIALAPSVTWSRG
jgi:hypothetical protein